MKIVSVNQVNFTVTVEDEYTYFGADRPLVEGATISLTPSYGGITWYQITNSSGVNVSVIDCSIEFDIYCNLRTV